MICIITQFTIADLGEYYQVKNLSREIDLTKGQFLTETAKMQISVKQDNGPDFFDYPIPFTLYQKVSSYVCRIGAQSLKSEFFIKNDALSPVYYIRSYLGQNYSQGAQFAMTCQYIAISDKFTNKYQSLFTPEAQYELRESDRSRRDRSLRLRLTSLAAMPVDVSTQTLKIKTPYNCIKSFDTESTPLDNTSSTITIGPVEYADTDTAEYIVLEYYAEQPTLLVNSKREVQISGFLARIGEDGSQLGLAHIVDTFHFKNLDPAPRGLRRSRIEMMKLKQAAQREISEITVTLPKASNIEVKDRTGKVSSSKILQETDKTSVVFTPRIELYGQDQADIIIEYDSYVVQQAFSDYGVVIEAVGKISPSAFYENFEVCIYPPSGASAVFQSQYPVAFNKTDEKHLNFDFQARKGQCASYGFSDYTIAGKTVGAKWQLGYDVLTQRVGTVAAAIFISCCALWIIRVIFKC